MHVPHVSPGLLSASSPSLSPIYLPLCKDMNKSHIWQGGACVSEGVVQCPGAWPSISEPAPAGLSPWALERTQGPTSGNAHQRPTLELREASGHEEGLCLSQPAHLTHTAQAAQLLTALCSLRHLWRISDTRRGLEAAPLCCPHLSCLLVSCTPLGQAALSPSY